MTYGLRQCSYCGAPSQPERCAYCKVARGEHKGSPVPEAGNYRVEVEVYERPDTMLPALRVVRYPVGHKEPDALLCADGTWWIIPPTPTRYSHPIPPETGAAYLPLGKTWRDLTDAGVYLRGWR